MKIIHDFGRYKSKDKMTSPSLLCLRPALGENCMDIKYYLDTEDGYKLACQQFEKEKRILMSDVDNLHGEIDSLELSRDFFEMEGHLSKPRILLLRLRRKIDYDYNEFFIWWINKPQDRLHRFISYDPPFGKRYDQVPTKHLEEDDQTTLEDLIEKKMSISQ